MNNLVHGFDTTIDHFRPSFEEVVNLLYDPSSDTKIEPSYTPSSSDTMNSLDSLSDDEVEEEEKVAEVQPAKSAEPPAVGKAQIEKSSPPKGFPQGTNLFESQCQALQTDPLTPKRLRIVHSTPKELRFYSKQPNWRE